MNDRFITKVGSYCECVLCKEDKKIYWKAKDAPRHLRKFHFGLADVCGNWYAQPVHDFSLNTSLTIFGLFL